MKNFKNMFLALALIFVVAPLAANTVPVVEVVKTAETIATPIVENVQKTAETIKEVVASTDSNSIFTFVAAHKVTFAIAAVVLGAVVYYVATAQDDSDYYNI
jgi:hypothetical protein